MGEAGGELPGYAREASSAGGRPRLPRWHLLQIQELRLSAAWLPAAQHGLDEEKVEQSERIKTRQHHMFILDSWPDAIPAESVRQ